LPLHDALPIFEVELAAAFLERQLSRPAKRGHGPCATIEVALGVDTGRDTELNRHRCTHTALVAQHDEAVHIGVATTPATPLHLALAGCQFDSDASGGVGVAGAVGVVTRCGAQDAPALRSDEVGRAVDTLDHLLRPRYRPDDLPPLERPG